MKTLLIIGTVAIAMAAALESCSSSNNSQPATVNLTSSIISLSGTDTTGWSDASLSCNCECDMDDMMADGDTGIIHFNIAEHEHEHTATHHILATVHPGDAESGKTYTCTFHFTMHDPMVMGGMQDYPTTITATYHR